jgi:hypothetical protein
LKAIASPAAFDPWPLVTFVRSLTVANVDDRVGGAQMHAASDGVVDAQPEVLLAPFRPRQLDPAELVQRCHGLPKGTGPAADRVVGRFVPAVDAHRHGGDGSKELIFVLDA